ncbi:cytochrome oxidase assembly protein [Massilia arenosa]|uniref:Cytochrome oxidase assembly protein n=1 Tax=Zemynaea arenosa TaxID=2561931 RepID=A0A4Y9S7A7_9BURK|nr:FixH family protein [Massilia arenosa]TFW17482.1 cytochrome oxidase assembly protein [Massilia arenosa]
MQATLNANAGANTPWYKHRWPWFLMLGPAAVVVAGSYTIYLAVTRQDAMVVGDYYKQGKAINQDLRRDRVATQLSLSLGMHYDAEAHALRGMLSSAAMPMSSEVHIRLAHPTQPEKDVQLLVRAGADGRFSVALPQLEQARWQVTAENGARSWRLEGAWLWPRETGIELKADQATND